MEFKARILLFIAPILIGLGVLLIVQSQGVGRLRIIFCDVGQGDGMLIISPGGKQVVVDGGPGRKIVECLGEKMPFWDRKIELMVSTHAQKDHMEGLVEVLARYDVGMIAATGIGNETAVFAAWEKAVKDEGAKVYAPNVGDRLVVDDQEGQTLDFVILWPHREQIAQWRENSPKDLNESSIVARLEYGDFCAYLTGDIPKEILETLIERGCQVLKVSHHGSKTGTNKEIVDLVNPAVAVIQVGKNSFGHPTKEVLDILESKGVKILRNDINGVIEVESDGASFRVKVESGEKRLTTND